MNTHSPRFILGVALAAAAPAWGQADLGGSVDCFDVAPSPCTLFAFRDPPDPVRYALHFINTGAETALDVRLRDSLNNLGSACGGALDPDPLRPPTCTADPATCGGNVCTNVKLTGGIVTAEIAAMPPGCKVDLVIDSFVRSGSAGTCCNEGEAIWTDTTGSNQRMVTPQACFNAGLPNLVIRNELDPPGQRPAPGDAVTFLVTVTNENPIATLADGLVEFKLDSRGCLHIADCTAVACAPSSSCGACTTTLTPEGFTHAIRNLGPRSSMTFSVVATADAGIAGSMLCSATAETSDADPLIERSVVFVPIGPPPCPLLKGDAVFPPVQPVLSALYSRGCDSGGDLLLGDVLQVSAAPGDLGESWSGVPGSLRLYQIDCGAACASRIGLTKNLTAAQVRMEYF